MKANHSLRNERILGVAPSTRGFGFAVLENGALIDWGIKSVTSEKNGQSLRKLENLVDHYRPGCIALSDYSPKQSCGWNAGTRPEETSIDLSSLPKLQIMCFN